MIDVDEPAPDEGAVRALLTIFNEARWAFETSREAADLREDVRQHEALKAGLAAVYASAGGREAAMRAALADVLFPRVSQAQQEAVVQGRRALHLTHSAAGEAVQRLVEAVDTLLTCRADMGKGIPGWGGRLDDAYVRLADAAQPFLAARGGDGR